MSIDEILTMMDEMIEKGWSMPLSGGKCLVEAEKMRQMIDDIRANMPGEIKQARMIVSDRSDIINNARQEADRLIQKAEEKANQMVAENEITLRAKAQAKEILERTQAKCNEQMRAAAEFSDKLIFSTEEALTGSLKVVKEAKEAMKHSRRHSVAPMNDRTVDIKLD